MARTVSYVLNLDFKNALKAAEEVGSKLDSSVSEALKHNRHFTNLMTGFKNIHNLQEKFQKSLKKFNVAEDIRQKKANGELGKHANELRSKLSEVQQTLKESASLTEEQTEELKKQSDELTEQLRLSTLIEKNFEGFVEELKGLSKVLHKDTKNVEVMETRLAQSAESAKELLAAFKDLVDPSKVADNLENAAERATDVFKDGIDVQALSRDLGKGLSKGINTAFKTLSGGSEAVMAIGGAFAGVVAGLGLLLSAFIAVDKKVKEFNKELVKTHGALSVMRLGGGSLNRGMEILNHTMKDLVGNLGVSEQEAATLFDTLDKGGLTLDSFTRGLATAEDKQEALRVALTKMHAAANLMGVSLSEYADNLTNYVNDLGMSADSVNESFASVAEMAAKSSFGTRRFYSMVVQATSGQASLNTRLEDTGDLLLRMSKIMGAKKAAELAGKFAQGLSGMSTQERLQMNLQSRGGMRRVIERESRGQTQTFGQRANVGAMSTAFARSGQSAVAAPVVTAIRDLQGLTENATAEQREQANRNLQRQIRELSPQNQEDLINSLVSSSDRDAQQSGQQLRDIVTLMRGQSDNLAAQTEAMSAFGARGAMAATLARVEGVLGRQFDVSNPRAVEQLVAMENIGQITSEQRQQLTRLVSSSRSQYDELKRMQTQQGALSEADRSRLEELGYTIERGADGQKHILQATYGAQHQILTRGLEIQNARDIFQLQNEAVTGTKERMESAEGIAFDTMEATVSMADIMENQVVQLLQGVYESLSQFIQPILEELLDAMPGDAGNTLKKFRTGREMTGLIAQQIQTLDSADIGRSRRMGELQGTLAEGSTASDQEKERAREELRRLRSERESAQTRRRGLVEARTRVSRGEGTGDASIGETRYRAESLWDFASDVLGVTVGMAAPDSGRLFNTEEEARRYAGEHGHVSSEMVRRPLTAQERLNRLTGTPASGVPAPAAPPAPAAQPVPSPRHAEAANAPAVQATDTAAAEQAARDRKSLDAQKKMREELARLAQGKNLGDGLAASRLPDAIADADAKMRLTEALFKAGKNEEQVARMLTGNVTAEDGRNAGYGGLLRARQLRQAHDFVYQDRGGRSVVTPIDRQDQVIGMKAGGPIAAAAGRGTGGNVNISINGGDERRVFEVVRRAIQQAGITPNRVPSGGT